MGIVREMTLQRPKLGKRTIAAIRELREGTYIEYDPTLKRPKRYFYKHKQVTAKEFDRLTGQAK
jgi:hypothetical protein